MRIFVDGECGAVPPTLVMVKLLLSPRKAGDLPLINLMDSRATVDTCQHFGVDGVRQGSKAVARQFRLLDQIVPGLAPYRGRHS
jgi:hypothetical protein